MGSFNPSYNEIAAYVESIIEQGRNELHRLPSFGANANAKELDDGIMELYNELETLQLLRAQMIRK